MYRLSTSFGIAIFALVIGLFAYWYYVRSKERQYLIFALLSFSAMLYSCMAGFIQGNFHDPPLAHSYRRFGICGPIMMVVFTLHFTFLFVGRMHKPLLVASYATSIGFCVMSIFNFFFYTDEIIIHDMAFSEQDYVAYKPDMGFVLFSFVTPLLLGYSYWVQRSRLSESFRFMRWTRGGLIVLLLAGSYDLLWSNGFITENIFPLFEFAFLGFVACVGLTCGERYIDEKKQLETYERKITQYRSELIRLQSATIEHFTMATIRFAREELQAEYGMFVKNLTEVLTREFNDSKLADSSRFSVKRLTLEMHMNKRALNSKIKELTGLNTRQFVKTIRLQAAAHLLIHEPLKDVTQIAFATGFNNLSHFIRSFREHFDCAPLEYRAKNAL